MLGAMGLFNTVNNTQKGEEGTGMHALKIVEVLNREVPLYNDSASTELEIQASCSMHIPICTRHMQSIF